MKDSSYVSTMYHSFDGWEGRGLVIVAEQEPVEGENDALQDGHGPDELGLGGFLALHILSRDILSFILESREAAARAHCPGPAAFLRREAAPVEFSNSDNDIHNT